MVVFVSYPMAPPRLAGLGYVDTVTRSSRSYRYLQPPAFVNQYAAMPSLHVGWDLLAGMAIFTATTIVAVRVLACLMPVLMVWAVIATGNHYLLDVVAGCILVLVGYGLSLLLERRRNRARPAPLVTAARDRPPGRATRSSRAAPRRTRSAWTSSSATCTTTAAGSRSGT